MDLEKVPKNSKLFERIQEFPKVPKMNDSDYIDCFYQYYEGDSVDALEEVLKIYVNTPMQKLNMLKKTIFSKKDVISELALINPKDLWVDSALCFKIKGN